MTELIKRLLIQALKDYAEKTFTFDNLKLVRDRFLTLLKEQVEESENKIDDWAFPLVEKIFADENLKKVYDYVQKYAEAILNPTICKADSESSLETLAKELEYTEAPEVCAMPDLTSVVAILEIIVPLLVGWLRKK